jgi:hypothetical protein
VDSWEKVLAHSAGEWTGSESLPSLLGDAIVLAAMEHEISMIGAFSPLGGQACVIRIGDSGLIDQAHDPRSDGGAIRL